MDLLKIFLFNDFGAYVVATEHNFMVNILETVVDQEEISKVTRLQTVQLPSVCIEWAMDKGCWFGVTSTPHTLQAFLGRQPHTQHAARHLGNRTPHP